MATLTGSSGALFWRGELVAKVRQFSLNLNKDALDDTCIGVDERTYVPGLFGASGTATVLLNSDDQGGRAMLQSIFINTADNDIGFTFSQQTGQLLEAQGFLTNVSPSVSVGDIQSASISFQLSGKVSGVF